MEKKTWEKFFDAYAPKYKDEPYVHNTDAEIDFIVNKFGLRPGMRILDIGCGIGRHSLEFSRRGYSVTGIDLSENMLNQARNAALEEGLVIDFRKADATNFSLESKFDMTVCLCEGSFGLLGREEEPFLRDVQILKNIHACLVDNGLLFMTILNGCRFIRLYNDQDVENGTFDNLHCVEHLMMDEYPEAGGEKLTEKAFTPSEIQLMLHMTGFICDGVAGGTAGSWNDKRLLMDEMELMVWGRKG